MKNIIKLILCLAIMIIVYYIALSFNKKMEYRISGDKTFEILYFSKGKSLALKYKFKPNTALESYSGYQIIKAHWVGYPDFTAQTGDSVDDILVKDVLEIGFNRESNVIYGLTSVNVELALGLSISEKVSEIKKLIKKEQLKGSQNNSSKSYFLINAFEKISYFENESELIKELKSSYQIDDYNVTDPRSYIDKNKNK